MVVAVVAVVAERTTEEKEEKEKEEEKSVLPSGLLRPLIALAPTWW
jgi:hypothetical protein